MTARKKTVEGERKGRKLKLKKETLKDLDSKPRAGKVKGGGYVPYASPAAATCKLLETLCICPTDVGCPPATNCPLWTCANK